MKSFTLILISIIPLSGLVGLVNPRLLIQFIRDSWKSKWIFPFAVGIRLIGGTLFLLISESTRHPTLIHIFGYLFILSGVTGLLLGKRRLTKLIDWFISKPPGLTRFWSIFAIAFGSYLIYAII